MRYESILIPTDGRSGMADVTEHAIGLAEICGAAVHVLHVVDDTAYQSIPPDARDQVQNTLKDDGRAATGVVAERAENAGLEVTEVVRSGDPAVVILAYAVEHDIDLIVMGTRGKSGFERYLIGSVAEKVVRASPVPVLTFHIGDREALVADIEDYLAHEPTA